MSGTCKTVWTSQLGHTHTTRAIDRYARHHAWCKEWASAKQCDRRTTSLQEGEFKQAGRGRSAALVKHTVHTHIALTPSTQTAAVITQCSDLQQQCTRTCANCLPVTSHHTRFQVMCATDRAHVVSPTPCCEVCDSELSWLRRRDPTTLHASIDTPATSRCHECSAARANAADG